MFELNTEIFLYIHSLSFGSPKVWMFLASWFGVVIGLLALLFVGLHKHGFKSIFKEFKQHLLEWRSLIFIPLATWAVTDFLKLIFGVPRPYLSLDITPLSMPGTFDSFPSGHSAFYMAIGFAVYRYHKKAGIIFMVLAAVLSISRIFIGVHYPSDILAGWLVAYLMYRLVKNK
ncbi:phosphatase PAP2 family protein [Candidatus Parcubacteria bacterium]|nr:phosphatase PAP2 family protein [Candidatus Parcubacteria bacterium]